MSDAEVHKRFYDEYNAVLDMPAEFYLDTIRMVFQEFSAAQRHLGRSTAGWCARPTSARTSLLAVEGELDDISGRGPDPRGHGQLCRRHPGRAQVALLPRRGAGHYGIFLGRAVARE